MGHYEFGGSNAVGVGKVKGFVGVWNPDTLYIQVIEQGFFERHEKGIMEAYVRGENYATDDGANGAVDAIHTGSLVDESGWPRFHDTPSEFVQFEMTRWDSECGNDFRQAIADGYANGNV
ncbi:hypothetical protein ABT282_07320 [Streptomyces sp. NPDC000927]|uniref:hypothetical protein n=1 Tax=Streptomyces sp. NPDC000927 TaxID=3154371 RepID=UPI0033222F80